MVGQQVLVVQLAVGQGAGVFGPKPFLDFLALIRVAIGSNHRLHHHVL
jgi:hypothetical protein